MRKAIVTITVDIDTQSTYASENTKCCALDTDERLKKMKMTQKKYARLKSKFKELEEEPGVCFSWKGTESGFRIQADCDVEIIPEQKSLPIGTVILERGQEWVIDGHGTDAENNVTCYYSNVNGESALVYTRKQRLETDGISVISYPGETEAAWEAVVDHLMVEPHVRTTESALMLQYEKELLFDKKLSEIQAANDKEYGYPRVKK